MDGEQHILVLACVHLGFVWIHDLIDGAEVQRGFGTPITLSLETTLVIAEDRVTFWFATFGFSHEYRRTRLSVR